MCLIICDNKDTHFLYINCLIKLVIMLFFHGRTEKGGLSEMSGMLHNFAHIILSLFCAVSLYTHFSRNASLVPRVIGRIKFYVRACSGNFALKR